MESQPFVVYHFADAEFEQLSGALRVRGQTHRLRPQTAAVLAQLLEHAGQLVTHDRLIQLVWGDTIVTDNSLAQCVSEIRGVLAAPGEPLIETVPRRGYILRAAVRRTLQGQPLPETPMDLSIEPARLVGPPSHPAHRWVPWLAAALGVLFVAALWLGMKLVAPAEPLPLSLAVLPFQNRSVEPGQAWFAENVGEDITTNLSRIPGAHVIAHVSTQAYKAASTDVRQVGRELGVRYVVAGHVDRDGDRVTMSLHLADTGSGAIRWTERFDTTVADLHLAEREVADRVANTLHVRLVAAEAQRLEQRPDPQPVADELALEAWAAWNRGSPADVARAKELALKALALDERSVLAWKTVSSWYLRARISQSIPAEEAVAGAEAAARRAMDIDPSHPLVHTVYGGALALRGRYEEAQRALEHEIATNPSHPVAYYYLGLSHLMRGQSSEAIALYQRAITISPRDPRMSRFQRYLALAYLHRGDMRSSLRHARAATEVPQVDRSAWAMLASTCALSGDTACAEAAATRLRQLWPAFTIAQGEAEWPPARPAFTAQHEAYLQGLRRAGLSDPPPRP